MILPRRKFLVGLGALLAAPAIVKATSLMPVRSIERFLGLPQLLFYDTSGNLVHVHDAPSLPVGDQPLDVLELYRSPELTFNADRTCVIGRVALRHPKLGDMLIQLAHGPQYVTVGSDVHLSSFNVRARKHDVALPQV